jgi:hypothetical protein
VIGGYFLASKQSGMGQAHARQIHLAAFTEILVDFAHGP